MLKDQSGPLVTTCSSQRRPVLRHHFGCLTVLNFNPVKLETASLGKANDPISDRAQEGMIQGNELSPPLSNKIPKDSCNVGMLVST